MTRTALLSLALFLNACGEKEPDDSAADVDLDGDGVSAAEDCDDEDPSAFPGNPEACDGVDNDCNGEVDDGVSGGSTWYLDADGDGVGTDADTLEACAQPEGYAAQSGDCDDEDAAMYPGADEICDGDDNDCDGDEDEDAVDMDTWYRDTDKDGFGNDSDTKEACRKPTGYTDEGGDCDDLEPAAYPGAAEVCSDGADNDCSGDADCDDSTCGGEAVCAPDVESIVPGWGYYDETTAVTITGSGFDYKTVSSVSVTVGGSPVSNLTVVDGNTLTCEVPAGAKGVADVVVGTDNGDFTLSPGWAWRGYGVYMADGKEGVAGVLSFYDTDDATLTEIGSVGYAITGLAFSPEGVLYAVESTQYGYTATDSRLLTVDVSSGAGTVVGALKTSDGVSHPGIADITFVGSRLLGFSQEGDTIVEIDPSSGAVTVVGSSLTKVASGGIAYDPVTGMVYLAVDKGFYSVDPSTGAASLISSNFGGRMYKYPNSLTWHRGSLYGADSAPEGGSTNLSSMDASNGRITRVTAVANGVDAIASPSP